MKLNEVLDIALTYLGLNEELKVTGENITPASNKKLKVLLRCANAVYSEIASDYMRLIRKEKVTAVDGRIAYASLTNRVIDISGVYKDGDAVKFTVYPDYLEIDAQGEIEVIYSYLPEELELTADTAYGTGLSPTTFAAGIAGEYALANGMYEEAAAYERKFKEGLKANLCSRKSRSLPARRWV